MEAINAIGRRKEAVARVYLNDGKREHYRQRQRTIKIILELRYLHML